MTASRTIAAQRGIPEATCLEIDKLHEDIDEYIEWAIKEKVSECLVEVYLKDLEFLLQELWEFPEDDRFHTYFKKYLFKKQWYSRSFKCNTTGQVFTVPMSVKECDFYQWAEAYLDVGRLNLYSRMSNCTEIVSSDTKGENK